MKAKIALVLLLVLSLALCGTWKTEEEASKEELNYKQSRRFVFRNQCQQRIWIGGFGVPQLTRTGWEMAPGAE